MTYLDEQIRAAFEEGADHAPATPDFAPGVARRARQRRTRRLMAGGAGLAAAAVAATVLVGGANDIGHPAPPAGTSPAPAPTTSHTPRVTTLPQQRYEDLPEGPAPAVRVEARREPAPRTARLQDGRSVTFPDGDMVLDVWEDAFGATIAVAGTPPPGRTGEWTRLDVVGRGSTTPRTLLEGEDLAFALSPDRKQVAFSRIPKGGQRPRLGVLDRATGAVVEHSPLPGNRMHVMAWVPSGIVTTSQVPSTTPDPGMGPADYQLFRPDGSPVRSWQDPATSWVVFSQSTDRLLRLDRVAHRLSTIDMATGRETASLPLQGDVAYIPVGGRRLVVGPAQKAGTTYVVDPVTLDAVRLPVPVWGSADMNADALLFQRKGFTGSAGWIACTWAGPVKCHRIREDSAPQG